MRISPHTIVKIIAILLLCVNGIGAAYGGLHLIADPSGAGLQMPLSFLEHSPFKSYLIPGIILLIVNGILSFVTVVTILFKTLKYPLFIIAQGVLLTGWIIVQLLMLRIFYAPMHLTFIVIGITLIGCGLFLNKHRSN
ncbi:MAG: hypothetical protein BGO30_00605 [Bacteroidetes bacterium 41-46]|jgi:hypothetical protein|nr:MAG: hypothetical protein BGO30_00605 [Bacteroidetes bacterium 41-46]